jgi:nucleotide-binding universal stress UspA family protein
MSPFKHILVPIDFGAATQPAIDLALSLAQTFDAQVTLMYAFDVTAYLSSSPYVPQFDLGPVAQSFDRELKNARDSARKACTRVDYVMANGNPRDAILETAKSRGCDLIVIGTHGRRGVAHVVLGSVAERVVRFSPIPVLTVHPSPGAAATAA